MTKRIMKAILGSAAIGAIASTATETMSIAANADATTTIAMMRDVHLTSTDHIAVARPRTLARDHLNVEGGMVGATTDVMMTDVPPANTTRIVAPSHAHQIHADENHTLVRDARIRVLPLAKTEKETAEDLRLLLSVQGQNEDLPRLDVVHHQAMSLTAIVGTDLPETTALSGLIGMIAVLKGKNALLLLIVKQNAWRK